jgi:hypothetical protein
MASLSHRQGWSFAVLLTIFPCVFFASTTSDVPSSEVRIAFFATDQNNHLVEKIDKNDFAVVDGDEVIRDFRSLVRSDETALDIVLLVDASESVAPRYQAVIRMRMGDCLPVHHGFMVAMGGAPTERVAEACPEYTLISDKVVFVIVGRSSDPLIPLADVVDFRFHNNELAMRIDDAQKESKFSIKEMVLRSEWDMVQKLSPSR